MKVLIVDDNDTIRAVIRICLERFGHEVLGEAGRHARAAVGVPSLPLDAAVEIEAIFELA